MRLRSATAIALVLGLAAFSSSAMAASSEAKPETQVLPGNVGGEGAAGAVAREKGLIEKRDHMDTQKGAADMTEEKRLPGNVGGEGHAQPVGSPSESGYTTSSGAEPPATTPVEKRLPGNVGGEGSGKTK
jgi:hypothetical protein